MTGLASVASGVLRPPSGDGQTEAEGVPSQGGRGDALLRRMPLHLTHYRTQISNETLENYCKTWYFSASIATWIM